MARATSEEPRDLTLFGEPLLDSAYLSDSAKFVENMSSRVRTLLCEVSRLGPLEAEAEAVKARDSFVPAANRAKAAWKYVAWNLLVQPFRSNRTQYYRKLLPFIQTVVQDPQTLFLFAILIRNQPDAKLYEQLLNKHAGIASAYHSYCVEYTVAKSRIPEIDEMFNYRL